MDHKNINNLRLVALNRASDKVQYFYSNLNRKGFIDNLFYKYEIKDESFVTLLLTIGDIILGFYKIEDTVPLLQQELGIDPKTAALLGAEVLEFLAPLNDPNWQTPVEEEGQEESAAAVAAPVTAPARPISTMSVPPVATPTPSVQSAPSATPVVQTIPTVTPIPTPTPAYAEPHEPAYQPSPTVSEPTYQSSQNDLRPGRGPLGEVPTYVPPVTPVTPPTPPAANRPRWSTDV